MAPAGADPLKVTRRYTGTGAAKSAARITRSHVAPCRSLDRAARLVRGDDEQRGRI